MRECKSMITFVKWLYMQKKKLLLTEKNQILREKITANLRGVQSIQFNGGSSAGDT